MRLLPSVALSLAACLAVAAGPVRAGEQVTIYRCVDARGKLTLRDTPCAKGEQQETRTMVRPKDAPPRPASSTPPSRDREIVVVERPAASLVPARPLYECITPDGERYASDTAEGNPRWVPLWTLGYPVYPTLPRRESGFEYRIGNRHVGISGGSRVVVGPVYSPAAYGAGTWVRDSCHPLPQDEVCDRLRDRRDEVRRRFFNAQPSERDVLRVEERGLNARLANDCGVR